MVRVLALFASFFVCYIVLAGEAKAEDVGMGLAAAALATSLAIAQTRTARFRFGYWLPPKRAFGVFAQVAPELVKVARCLFAAIVSPPLSTGRGSSGQTPPHYGAYVRQPYAQSPNYAEPREITRNAWLTLLISVLPQSFAVRRDFDHTLILHALPPRPPSSDEAWPQ